MIIVELISFVSSVVNVVVVEPMISIYVNKNISLCENLITLIPTYIVLLIEMLSKTSVD